MSDWNPEQYKKFLAQRTRPSIDLAERVTNAPRTIFDLGCGPGNSTQTLADKFPEARVTGGDFSESMLKTAAAAHPGIEFIRFDAARDFSSLDRKFDLIFSNACIQWVPDHPKLLAEMMDALNPGGMLAVQTPLQDKHPMHRLMSETAALPKWKNLGMTDRNFHNLTQPEYFDVLSGISSDFEMWETVYCHRMPSLESIIEWYRGTGLRPFLDQLTPEQGAEFERDLLEQMRSVYPKQRNGEIMFYFPRLFFIAYK